METFTHTFGFVIAIAIGIMLLAVFFTILSKLSRTKEEPAIIKLKGFFKNAERVDIHLGGSNVLKRVKVIGVSDSSQLKGGFPFELNGMVVLEKENGKRMMIKAKLINMIVESEPEGSEQGSVGDA